ncbi:MAG: hypothetical protein J6F30_05585 [Cellulosilyticum sp.]|nr:hypothetical protein [Cellulosilyticum sp.]
MYLDVISTSKRAISLYQKLGFIETKRYNNSQVADVFMELNLDEMN